MPLYEYRCAHCGNHTEILQKMSDEPAVTCPDCHHDALTKKISAPQFQLKGSGWYVTDFRDKKKTESVKTEPAKTEPAKSETKTESAAKTDTETKT